MKNKYIRKITVAFRWSVSFLLVCSILSLVVIYQANYKEHWVQHTYQVIQKTEYLLSTLKDAETGVRGYVIARDTSTLEPYAHSRDTVMITFNQIRLLTSDNPAQQRTLGELLPIINDKYRILALDITQIKQNKPVTAALIFQGKYRMDKIRKMVEIMKNRELVLLRQRDRAWKNTWGMVPLFIIILTLAGTITAFYFCRKLQLTYFDKVRFRRRMRQETILATNRVRIIQHITAAIAAGDYKVGIEGNEKEILGVLADNINTMSKSLDHSFTTINEWLHKKDDFINITAHEMRTPLTTVKAALQYLQDSLKNNHQVDEKAKFFLEKANNQINKLIKILHNIFEGSKITTRVIQLDQAVFPIIELVRESIDLLTADNKHKVVLLGDEQLLVRADKLKIEQVLNNLLSNAMKYSSPDTLIVVTINDLVQHVEVRVKDFGIGIPNEKLSLIFERYFRVSDQTNSGMGLGLYISKGIIEQHGCQIGAESEPHKGTTVWFTLPKG